MFTHNIDPVMFSIGPLDIRYYGLAYVLGFLLVYWVMYKVVEKKAFKGLSKKLVDDLIMWLVIGVVAGGRLGYFLFYKINTFFVDPLEILQIWHGGMSFHGGLLGACIATYYFAKKNKISFYKLADLIVIPTAIALGIGRIANFINGEIVGTKSSVAWCFEFSGYEGCRHPVQLYLSLKNFAVAGILWFLSLSKRKSGYLFWQFVLWYGVGRFLVEFVRFENRYLGISTGQYLSLIMVAVSLYVLWKDR